MRDGDDEEGDHLNVLDMPPEFHPFGHLNGYLVNRGQNNNAADGQNNPADDGQNNPAPVADPPPSWARTVRGWFNRAFCVFSAVGLVLSVFLGFVVLLVLIALYFHHLPPGKTVMANHTESPIIPKPGL